MLLDEALGGYGWSERHSIEVAASPPAVLAAVRAVTAAEMPLVGAIMAVRSLPSRLAGRRRARAGTTRPVLDDIVRSGFVPLAESDGEVVVGIVGRFWQPCPTLSRIASPDEFRAFATPGWAKAAMSFHVEPLPDGRTRLTTETRITATDAGAARRFRVYWTFVRPGSGLIRRLWLRAVHRRAERNGFK